MNYGKYQTAVDVTNMAIIYLVSLSLYMLVAAYSATPFTAAVFLMLAAFPLFFYFVRKNTRRLHVYVLLNILFFAAALLIPLKDFSKVFIVCYCLGYLICNIRFWVNKSAGNVGNIHVASVFIIILAYFIGLYKHSFYADIIYCCGILFVVSIAFRIWFENAFLLGKSGQLTENMPIREIFRNELIMVLVISLSTAALMFFIRAQRLIEILSRIGLQLRETLLYWAGRLLKYLIEHANANTTDNIEPSYEEYMTELVNQERSSASELVDAVVMFFLSVFLICIICRLLWNFIRSFKSRRPRAAEGKILKNKNEIHERLTGKDVFSLPAVPKTNAERVRFLYKKKLLFYKKKGVSITNMHTPCEHGSLILKDEGRDISLSTAIYENARYNPDADISAADVKKLSENLA